MATSFSRIGNGAITGLVDRGRELLQDLGLAGSRETTSITIEHGFIKLLVSQGREVLDYRIAVANPLYFREGLVSDPAQIGGILRAASRELLGSHRRMIGAVPGYQTTLARIELPITHGMDPGVVIAREAGRTMGISPTTSYVTWKRLSNNFDMGRWLVMSATRRSITSLIQTVEAAEFSLATMEMRPFALARAANRSDAAIAWTSVDGCEVIIVRDSVPIAQQSAYWGAETVDSTVLVNRLTDIVGRTIASYDSENRDTPLPQSAPLFVTGSPVELERNVGLQVATNLQRPPGVLEPPLDLPSDFPVHDLAVNIGLALWEV